MAVPVPTPARAAFAPAVLAVLADAGKALTLAEVTAALPVGRPSPTTVRKILIDLEAAGKVTSEKHRLLRSLGVAGKGYVTVATYEAVKA